MQLLSAASELDVRMDGQRVTSGSQAHLSSFVQQENNVTVVLLLISSHVADYKREAWCISGENFLLNPHFSICILTLGVQATPSFLIFKKQKNNSTLHYKKNVLSGSSRSSTCRLHSIPPATAPSHSPLRCITCNNHHDLSTGGYNHPVLVVRIESTWEKEIEARSKTIFCVVVLARPTNPIHQTASSKITKTPPLDKYPASSTAIRRSAEAGRLRKPDLLDQYDSSTIIPHTPLGNWTMPFGTKVYEKGRSHFWLENGVSFEK